MANEQHSTDSYRFGMTIGDTIAGRYTLLKKLGEGGMGEVWSAKQEEPVRRKVAVKFIKPGMDSRAVVARFEAERQALALMDHSNIARVYDGGIGPDGCPFFAMELVDGAPLLHFCDQRRLDPRQRLELFIPICQAVQHAHQKGVIHRDLKPSNILVTVMDGNPLPKVIDFGVAKAVGGKLTDAALTTQFGAVVGTLEYMAPEQAGVDDRDVDTRADLYSLGVILYELLTGLRPFDGKRLRLAAFDEVARILREEEPAKPSTRLSGEGSLPSLAAARHIEPKRLLGLLRGELDWVVMKCLEKDRNRRYETANGLARELQRYLVDEPVEARPPSAGYRIRKFVRRHRPQVIAAGLVLVLLIGGIAGTSYGLYRAEEARAREELRAEGETQAKIDALTQKTYALAAAASEKTAKEQAQRRLAQVQRGNELLGSIFTDLNLREVQNKGRKLEHVLGERLKKMVVELKGESIGEPLVVAELQEKLGISLRNLGFLAESVAIAEEVHATRTKLLRPDDPVALAGAVNLGGAYLAAGKLNLALPLLKDAVPRCKAKLGPTHAITLEAMHNLASRYYATKQFDLALPLLEETYQKVLEINGPDHPNTLNCMISLATGYHFIGKTDRALPMWEKGAKLFEAKFGPEHSDTLVLLNNLAQGYRATGRLNDALPIMDKVFRGLRTTLGADHPNTLVGMSNLAGAYHEAGKFDLDLPMYEEALRLQKAKIGMDHPDTIITMNKLGMAYWAIGNFDRCLPVWEETLRLRKLKFGMDHPDTIDIMAGLARAYVRAKKADLGFPLYEQFLAAHRRKLGPQDSRYGGWLATVSLDLIAEKQFAAAEPYLREAKAIFDKNEPRGWKAFNTQVFLGEALLGQKKLVEAESMLLLGYAGMKSIANQIPPAGKHRPAEAIGRLIDLYSVLDKTDEVNKWKVELSNSSLPHNEPGKK